MRISLNSSTILYVLMAIVLVCTLMSSIGMIVHSHDYYSTKLSRQYVLRESFARSFNALISYEEPSIPYGEAVELELNKHVMSVWRKKWGLYDVLSSDQVELNLSKTVLIGEVYDTPDLVTLQNDNAKSNITFCNQFRIQGSYYQNSGPILSSNKSFCKNSRLDVVPRSDRAWLYSLDFNEDRIPNMGRVHEMGNDIAIVDSTLNCPWKLSTTILIGRKVTIMNSTLKGNLIILGDTVILEDVKLSDIILSGNVVSMSAISGSGQIFYKADCTVRESQLEYPSIIYCTNTSLKRTRCIIGENSRLRTNVASVNIDQGVNGIEIDQSSLVNGAIMNMGECLIEGKVQGFCGCNDFQSRIDGGVRSNLLLNGNFIYDGLILKATMQCAIGKDGKREKVKWLL